MCVLVIDTAYFPSGREPEIWRSSMAKPDECPTTYAIASTGAKAGSSSPHLGSAFWETCLGTSHVLSNPRRDWASFHVDLCI